MCSYERIKLVLKTRLYILIYARACVCVFEVIRAVNLTVRGVTDNQLILATSGNVRTCTLIYVGYACQLCKWCSFVVHRQIVGRVSGVESMF